MLKLLLLAAVPLFSNGTSEWKIALPENASKPLLYAAEELATTIKKISGATLPIVGADDASSANRIRIVAEGDRLEDEFSVRTTSDSIVLSGSSPRAALFAIYAFLQERLDCRWYWPGESGEFLPHLDHYEVSDFSKTWKPRFTYREFSICGYTWKHRHAETERWFAKVFLNSGANTPAIADELGFIRIISDHAVSLPIQKDVRKRLFAEHPDWFSLINGKRDFEGIAGCWSSAGYTEWLVQKLVAKIREEKADVANLFVADVVPRCECEGCAREADKSARWWKYYAKLIEGVRRELPGQRFAGLAYQEYRPVPSCRVEGLEYVEYCQYNRCYYHPLATSGCKYNENSQKEFRAWGKQATLGLYGYEFDVWNRCLYLPMWEVFADEMRAFDRLGLKRVKTEYSVNLQNLTGKNPQPRNQIGQLVNRLAYYCWAKCAFDPTVDVQEVVRDFCRHVYGAGWEPMYEYHRMMSDAWTQMRSHVTYFGNSPVAAAVELLPTQREARAKELLQTAATAAAGNKRAVAEVRLDAECLVNWARVAEEGRSGTVNMDLAVLDGGDPFNMIGWLDAVTPKGKAQRTRFKLYRGTDGLHVLASCRETDPEFVRGETENDKQNWNTPSIEIFLECGDGASRQIVISPAGGVWDAKDGDRNWNSGAVVRPTFDKESWMLAITLPYAGLDATPKAGDKWKMLLIRNPRKGNGNSPTGWPKPAHRDYGSAATLRFK